MAIHSRHKHKFEPAGKRNASASIPDAGFLTLSKVLELYPIGKALWDAGVRTGRYPAPVRLAPRVLAWK
jgi:predicted DNA-binding transcriptional regulator AlpA